MSATGLKITNFHYSNTSFPQVGFVEYPKWIHMPGYPSQIVETAQEEAVLRARPPKEAGKPMPDIKPEAKTVVAPPSQILTGTNDEREILLAIAEEKKIKVDKRWKTDRLRATIERETAHL